MRIVVTGGAGFIGSNFIHYLLRKDQATEVINIDCLTYAGNLDNLSDIQDDSRYHFVQADIVDKTALIPIFSDGVDAVVHLAAESHVDRSIATPEAFVHANIVGTATLLELSRTYGVQKFVQVSTDEVYGTLGESGLFTEESPLQPNSPYSASKASADLLVRAYHETYGLNVNITRCSNNYGPYQHEEKLIPRMIRAALQDEPLPVYGDGLQVRDWLYVEDHCSAIDLVLRHAPSGEVYNVGGSNERNNLQVVRTILKELGKPESLIQHVADRLGHDRRYAIDATKIRDQLGWQPSLTYETGIRETIRWYLNHDNGIVRN